jgi:hypothetical protein
LGSLHYGLFAAQELIDTYGLPKKPADFNNFPITFADPAIMELVLASIRDFGMQPRNFPFRGSGNAMLGLYHGHAGISVTRNRLGFDESPLIRILPEYTFIGPEFWLTMHSSLRRNT